MIEVSTTQATARAYQVAHEERARAMRSLWTWLFLPADRMTGR